MARQNIGIGAAPNDDTGDSLRVGADKANDNFIELYSMFDVWPGNFNFWPLGGSTALTSGLTVDGNGNTLDFIDLGGFSVDVGLNNMAFTGSVLSLDATNSIVWNVDDGVDVTDIDIDPDSVTVSTTDIHLNTTNSFNASADDGVDSSSFSLTPLGASFDRPIQLPSYTVGTLPAAATYPRCLVWVSDETDGACEAISNGTNWIRTYDGNIVS